MCRSIIFKSLIHMHVSPYLDVSGVSYFREYCIMVNHPIAGFFPAILKTAVIEEPIAALFETTGIGNPIIAFQHQRFINRCNMRPIVAVSKTAHIGSSTAAFFKSLL